MSTFGELSVRLARRVPPVPAEPRQPPGRLRDSKDRAQACPLRFIQKAEVG